MTTVTAFAYAGKAAGNGTANSFSYYAPEGGYSQVEGAVRSFIADVFAVY
jgi:L-cysteine desulfidase